MMNSWQSHEELLFQVLSGALLHCWYHIFLLTHGSKRTCLCSSCLPAGNLAGSTADMAAYVFRNVNAISLYGSRDECRLYLTIGLFSSSSYWN
jgi:hypothetical protein